MGALIDTSVWIDAFHPKSSASVKGLTAAAIERADAVLCEPVYLEFFRGVPDSETKRAQAFLSTLPMLSTPPSLWRDALPLLRTCAKHGSFINTLDALITVIALKHDVSVVTFDRDFLSLQEHCGVSVEFLQRPS
jgi:predicted nucleic acid-binding protein